MRRILYSVSVVMSAILVATVLAPTFGWEAATGVDGPSQFADAHGEHENDDTPGHGDEPGHDRHGCAGHMFSHLAALDNHHGNAGDDGRSVAISDAPRCVLTQFPRRIEHPPFPATLA